MKEEFKELDKDFKQMVKEEKMNISSLEDLMVQNIENYKKELEKHVEELLSSEINESDLVSKKNENGNLRDLLYEIKGKKN